MKGALAFSLINYSLGERTWLSRFTAVPSTKTLEVVHFVTLQKDQTPEVSLAGPVTLTGSDRSALQKPGVQLSIVSDSTLQELSKNATNFCCSQQDADQMKCNVDELYIPKGDYKSFSITEEKLKKGFGDVLHKINSTDLFYITLSNCGSVDTIKMKEPLKFDSGELVVVQRSGYLPEEEVPKLYFYFYLLSMYCVALSVWIVWCSRWSDVLFKIHHYITIGITAGVIEAACWYTSLYHWNYIGHRWWSMVLLASCGTVVKQGVCYGLLLLACLGLGVTKARLESKQIVQCFLLIGAFIVSDGVRQMAVMLQDRVIGIASTWKILMLVTPGSFFVSIIYVWTLQALQDTIKELKEQNQTVKLEVYTKLRMVLVAVIAVIVFCFGYESFIVRSADLSSNWQSRYIFSDVISHVTFYALLVVIMFLWRPNENSSNMAYSQQLNQNDEKQTDELGAEMADLGDDIQNDKRNFSSVDVELGDDPADDDFSFKKSMEEAKKSGKPVLE